MTAGQFSSGHTPHNKTDPDLLLERLKGLQLGTLTVTGVTWEVYGGRSGVAMATTQCLACGEVKKRAASNLFRGLARRCKCRPRKMLTPVHKVLSERYHAMVQRCNNPKNPSYKNYGARGIALEFSSVDEFTAWMLENLPHPDYRGVEIDRVDNNKGYMPGNLRLVPCRKNLCNTRRNRYTEYKGVTVVWAHLWDLIKTDHPEFPYGRKAVLRCLEKGVPPEQIPQYRRPCPGGRRSTTSLTPDPAIVSLYRA